MAVYILYLEGCTMYVSIKWWVLLFCKAVINLSDQITWPWCSIALQEYKRNGNWLWEKKQWNCEEQTVIKSVSGTLMMYILLRARAYIPSCSHNLWLTSSQVTTEREHNEIAMHIICTFTHISSWKVRSYPQIQCAMLSLLFLISIYVHLVLVLLII